MASPSSASPIQQPPTPSPLRSQPLRMLNDACFHCRNQGHWARDCPFKTPTKSPNPHPKTNQNPSPSSEHPNFPPIPCPEGHGSCFLGISQTQANLGRPFYSCSVTSPNGKCRFFMWLDQVKGFESDINVNNANHYVNVKRDRSQDYPDCGCRAGKCKVVQEHGRQYFVCPISKGHGACNFRKEVNEAGASTTVTSDGNEGNQADYLSSKRTKLALCVADNPDPVTTPVDSGPCIEEVIVANEECDDFLDLSADQEMALREGELGDFAKVKELQVSRLTSDLAIHRRQAEFLRQISAAGDTPKTDHVQQFLGTLISGWLGRLAFSPSGCLTVPQARPFLCCVFPSYDPIYVPKVVNGFHSRVLNDLTPSSYNVEPDLSRQISSQDTQMDVLSELSSIQTVPGIRQGRDFMREISKLLAEAGFHVQSQLLAILEFTDPSNYKAMEEAAAKIFAVLSLLSVDHSSFSECVKNFIARASSLAVVEESMRGRRSLKEVTEQYENAKANYNTLSRMHSEAKNAITASDQQLKVLGEEASLLREMLRQIENQLRQCKTENAELKTRAVNISENMLESEKKLQEAEAAKKLHEEREAERNAAKESLEIAKAQLRQSVITL